MERIQDILLQLAELGRSQGREEAGDAGKTPRAVLERSLAELQDCSKEEIQGLWACAAEQGLSLQSLTGYVRKICMRSPDRPK